jgi:hypothetical protein
LARIFQDQIFIDNHELPEFVKTYCKEATFVLHISPNATNQVLDLCDISQYTTEKPLTDEDRSLRTFLEMATSQHSINW